MNKTNKALEKTIAKISEDYGLYTIKELVQAISDWCQEATMYVKDKQKQEDWARDAEVLQKAVKRLLN